MKSKIDSYYRKVEGRNRIFQGDIYRDVELIFKKLEKDVLIEEVIKFPYVVVLTQDCDLESDYYLHINDKEEKDAYLPSILISPAYIEENIRRGNHLTSFNITTTPLNSKQWDSIKINENKRYHFLEGVRDFQVPTLIIDFKHYYSVPRDEMYNFFSDNYLVTINEIFREFLSQRFANFLSRIGTPEIKRNNQKCQDSTKN